MADVKFEIVEHVGVLSESQRGWKKELNLVNWNGKEPKYDIRSWDSEYEIMSKGITFTVEELIRLRDILNELEL